MRRINPNKKGAKAPKEGEEPFLIYQMVQHKFAKKSALKIANMLFEAAFMALGMVDQGDEKRKPLLIWVMDRAYEENVTPTAVRIDTDDGEVKFTKTNRRHEYVPAPVLKP